MMPTAIVLLVFDRQPLRKWGEGGGGEGAWVAGYRPMNAALLAWVRYGVEFLPAAALGVLSLSVFSLVSFFLPFLSYIL
jgi:hypothetical protein